MLRMVCFTSEMAGVPLLIPWFQSCKQKTTTMLCMVCFTSETAGVLVPVPWTNRPLASVLQIENNRHASHGLFYL
jgi:hypothetical protein